MSITPLPTPPSRSDRVNFAARGDALMAALPQFVSEANALAAAMGIPATGVIYVNDTANAQMTYGLTLNQLGADDEILALKSSGDVAHGMTALAETDTFGLLKKVNGNNGGLWVQGFNDGGVVGLQLDGFGVNDDATKSTAASAVVYVNASVKSGTGAGAGGANSNLMAVASAGVVRFILDADGDSHQDVGTAWTNFDTHDDLALLEDFSFAVTRDDDPIKANFAGFLKYNPEALEAAKLVTFDDDGRPFVNMSKLTMAHTGAIRQLGRAMVEMESRLAARMAALTASDAV